MRSKGRLDGKKTIIGAIALVIGMFVAKYTGIDAEIVMAIAGGLIAYGLRHAIKKLPDEQAKAVERVLKSKVDTGKLTELEEEV